MTVFLSLMILPLVALAVGLGMLYCRGTLSPLDDARIPLAIFGCLFVLGFVVSSSLILKSFYFEISDSQYEVIQKFREEDPRLQRAIDEALIDDVITGFEFQSIYDQKYELKRADVRSSLREPIQR